MAEVQGVGEGMRSIAVTAIAIVILVVMASFCVPTGRTVPFGWSSTYTGEEMVLNFTIGQTPHSKDITVLLQNTDRLWDGRAGILLDDAPWISEELDNGSAPSQVQGLYDHLVSELDKWSSVTEVSIVHLDDLDRFLASGASTLVIANDLRGDASISSKVKAWVENGGLLVAVGNHSIPFSYQSADEMHELGGSGPVLSYHHVEYNGGTGVTSSPFAEAYSLQYFAPYAAISIDDVERNNGTVIGYEYGGALATIASIPYGEGGILAFGGSMGPAFQVNGPDVVAADLVRLLMGGAAFSTSEPIFQNIVMGQDGGKGTLSVRIPARGDIQAVAFSNDRHNTLLWGYVLLDLLAN
ncbi:MAG: hypothetical protein A4E32_01226 [Methanomassiliicoccales archaeon PtaU1.Bin124]|nr:MAG: hypothetical protein A4E32_01226 [Methanomassiliicoccales archaeon PtaU1.Bin124]